MEKTQDRSVTVGRYAFDEGKHAHTLDGKPLMGVTTVLGIIAKPMLIQWSANMAVEYVQNNIGDVQMGISQDRLETILKEAKTAHRKKKEKAGDIGSAVHDAIEAYIKKGTMPLTLDPQGRVMFDNFLTWSTNNKVKFIKSELHVHSEKMWIGGILDLVIEVDGKRYIADIKTSSGIYNEHFFQMAAYDMCLEEMGEPSCDGYLVINLKKTGEMDLKVTENKEINREAFRSALKLYQITQSLK